jgi:hypothetical protein
MSVTRAACSPRNRSRMNRSNGDNRVLPQDHRFAVTNRLMRKSCITSSANNDNRSITVRRLGGDYRRVRRCPHYSDGLKHHGHRVGKVLERRSASGIDGHSDHAAN